MGGATGTWEPAPSRNWLEQYADWERSTTNRLCGFDCHSKLVDAAWLAAGAVAAYYGASVLASRTIALRRSARISANAITAIGRGAVVFQFGANMNQIYHTFRHIDKLGINRNEVVQRITLQLQQNLNLVKVGEPFIGKIQVNGIRLQYTAYRLPGPENIVNIGRIHAAP